MKHSYVTVNKLLFIFKQPFCFYALAVLGDKLRKNMVFIFEKKNIPSNECHLLKAAPKTKRKASSFN